MKEYKCDNCLVDFKRYSSTVKGKTVFCGNKCKGEYQKGENNPNYRKGNWQKESFCQCGDIKDSRSKKCAKCSRKGYSINRKEHQDDFDNQILEVVKNSDTISEVAKIMGISRYLASKSIFRLGINTSHMKRCNNRPYPIDEIFILRKEGKRNPVIRKHYFNLTCNNYFCSKCGQNSEWKGRELTLQLHHKNGNSLDDRLENLCWICPNCHSQTETFVGLNSRKDFNESRKKGGS